jgi:hypothetical protein
VKALGKENMYLFEPIAGLIIQWNFLQGIILSTGRILKKVTKPLE